MPGPTVESRPAVQGLLEQYLFDGIERGDSDQVRLRLKQGAAVQGPASQAPGTLLTPLHQAALYGRTALARVLLQAGADATLRDASGRDALHLACRHGRAEMVALLVDEFAADPAAADASNGWTPLHYAAAFCCEGALGQRVARTLVSAATHEQVLALSHAGQTALELAALSNNHGVAAIILGELAGCCDQAAARKAIDRSLCLAASCGAREVSLQLIDSGADVHLETSVASAESRSGASAGMSALARARQGGHAQLARELRDAFRVVQERAEREALALSRSS